MSREATATLSVGAPETHSEQTSERLSLPQKLAARGRAVLNNLNGLPMTKLPEAISDPTEEPEVGSTEWLEAKYNQPTHTPAHEIAEEAEPVHTEAVRRGFGSRILAHINLRIVEAYGAPAAIRAKEQAYHDSERFKAKETDSHLRRVSKFLGRNALRGAAAVAGAAGVAYYADSLYEHYRQAADTPRIVNATADHLPYRTAEVNLSAISTDIQVGGHTQGDPVASGYIDSLKAAGMYDDSNKNVPIFWSANMAPISGDAMPMTLSDAEGASKIVSAVNDANGAPVRIFAFSQGTEATARALNDLAAQNGGRVPDNVTVILEGTPSGDIGLGQSPYVHAVDPVLSALNLETHQPIPPGTHVIVRTDVADAFGNGGRQSGAKLLEMAGGPGHVVRGPGNGVLLYTYDKDGVTYEVYGDPDGVNDPLLRIAKQNGLPVTPQAEAFMEAVLPYTPPGSNGPVYADATNVKDKAADLIGDSIRINTGFDATPIAHNVADAVMTPGRTQDAQSMLDLTRIPDQATEIINNPASAPQNLNAIHNEIQNGAKTVGEYLKPNTWVDAINDGIRGAGVQGFQLPHFQDAPAPVAPAAAPPPAANPVAQFQQSLNLFGQNLQKNLANFGKPQH